MSKFILADNRMVKEHTWKLLSTSVQVKQEPQWPHSTRCEVPWHPPLRILPMIKWSPWPPSKSQNASYIVVLGTMKVTVSRSDGNLRIVSTTHQTLNMTDLFVMHRPLLTWLMPLFVNNYSLHKTYVNNCHLYSQEVTLSVASATQSNNEDSLAQCPVTGTGINKNGVNNL